MKVAIIGGSGKMGRWFADFLRKDGREVVITGRNETKLLAACRQLGVEAATSNAEAAKSADVVLLSVPPDNMERVIEEIAPHINSRQAVIDITSVKMLPVEAMHRHIKKGVVLGVHPMFGPGAESIASHNFVLTPTNDEEQALAQKIKRYLEDRQARVTLMSPGEHDEMMCVILGLSHLIAIVSADTLLDFDRLPLMRAIGGSTYKVLLTLAGSIMAENPELYASLQMSLPNLPEIEKTFQRNWESWAGLVAKKDRQQFTERMNALKSRLEASDPDFTQSYQNMYRLMKEL